MSAESEMQAIKVKASLHAYLKTWTESKKKGNDQGLIQSNLRSHPQNQNGKKKRT